jgi:hypothetical protein
VSNSPAARARLAATDEAICMGSFLAADRC